MNADLRPAAAQRAEQLAQASAAPAAWANQIAARRQSVGVAGLSLPLFRRVDLAARPSMAADFADRFTMRSRNFATGMFPLLRRVTRHPLDDAATMPDWWASAPPTPARRTAPPRSDQAITPVTQALAGDSLAPARVQPHRNLDQSAPPLAQALPGDLLAPARVQPRKNLDQSAPSIAASSLNPSPELEPDVQPQEPWQFRPAAGAAYQPVPARVFAPPIANAPGGSPLVRRLVEQSAFPPLMPAGAQAESRLVSRLAARNEAEAQLVHRLAARDAFAPLAARAGARSAPAGPLIERDTPALSIAATLAPERTELSEPSPLRATDHSQPERVAPSISRSRIQDREPVSNRLALLRTAVIRRTPVSHPEEAPAQGRMARVIEWAWSGATAASDAPDRLYADAPQLTQTPATRPGALTRAATPGRRAGAAAGPMQRAISDRPDAPSQPAAPTITPMFPPMFAPAITPTITPMFAPTIARLPRPAASTGTPALADESAVATRQAGHGPAIQEQPATPAASTSAQVTAPASASPNAPAAGILPPLAANILRRQVAPAPYQQPATLPMLRTRQPLTPSAGDMAETAATDTPALPITGDWASVEKGEVSTLSVPLASTAAPRRTIAPVMRSAIVPIFPAPDLSSQSRGAFGTDQRPGGPQPTIARPLPARTDPMGSHFVALQREAEQPDDLAQARGSTPTFAGVAGYSRASEQPALSDGDQTRGGPTFVRRSIGQATAPFTAPDRSFGASPAGSTREPVARSVALDLIQPMRPAARQAEEREQRTYSAIQMQPDESGAAEPAAPEQAAAAPAVPDIEALAKKVYDHLRRQLSIDLERRGR